VWLAHEREIDRVLDTIEDLAARARAAGHAAVICHADIHAWNVLVQPSGGFAIVDWNEVVLAPRERDMMFVEGGPLPIDDVSAFLSGYGDVEIDPVLIAYYRFEWVVEELADYGRRMFMMPELGDATKQESLELFENLFRPGRRAGGVPCRGRAPLTSPRVPDRCLLRGPHGSLVAPGRVR